MWVEQLMRPGEGDEELSEGSGNDHLAEGGRGKPKSGRTRKTRGAGRTKAGDVGRALRSVYDSTLREDVPGDFLDLLGRLS
jgi:anti-sigma factor NepR-like protein